MTSPCSNCRAHERVLWVLFSYQPEKPRVPELVKREQGNWITLDQCESCGSLWCTSVYEPYISFPYLVAWPRDAESWRKLHDADEGRTLLRWHAYEIARHWGELPEADRHDVEMHRQRSQGHNPVDSPGAFRAAPLPD